MNMHVMPNWGFPRQDIINLCNRLIRNGKDCRSDAYKYAKRGNHVKAFRLNREANDYHRRVLNMFNAYEGLAAQCRG